MNTREQYIENLKTQLDRWNSELSKWEEKSRQNHAQLQADYDKQLAEFRRQRDETLEQMQRIQNASGEAWKDFMRSADEAWARTRAAYEQACGQFRK